MRTNIINLCLRAAGMAGLCITATALSYGQQVIVASGGKFESMPPFTDYVNLQRFVPGTPNPPTTFDTVKTQSVQGIYLHNRSIYTCAQDSITLHHADNLTRTAATGFNQPAVLHITDEYVFAGRASYGTGHQLVWLHPETLQEITSFNTITTGVGGIESVNDSLYVTYNIKSTIDLFPPWGVYGDSLGMMEVYSISSQSLVRTVNLGTDAAGIGEIYKTGGDTLVAYGKDNNKLIRWYAGTGTYELTDVPPVTKLYGAGTGYLWCALKKQNGTKGIGRINSFTLAPLTADTIDIEESVYKKPGKSVAGFAALDAESFFVTTTDYTNPDTLYFVNNGAIEYKKLVGVSAEALLVDKQFSLSSSRALAAGNTTWLAYPNPARSGVSLNHTADEVKVYDLRGREVASHFATNRFSVSHLPAGLYVLKILKDGVLDRILLTKE